MYQVMTEMCKNIFCYKNIFILQIFVILMLTDQSAVSAGELFYLSFSDENAQNSHESADQLFLTIFIKFVYFVCYFCISLDIASDRYL